MKPVAFEYLRPESVEEAAAALAEHGDEAKVLAGGQSLVPALNMRIARPSVIVDVNRLPLGDVAWESGSWRVGALVRQADPRLLAHPLLADAIPYVGHFVTRNRGTVVGSLVHADASAELPLCLALLGGSVVTSSGRTVPAGGLYVTHWTTSLEPNELVVETVWPTPEPGWGYAFSELAQRRGDFALCAAAVAACGSVLRVAVGAVVDRPTLLEVDPEAPGESAATQVEPYGNLHASAGYLRNLVRVLVDRAAARARERAS
ncbi:MAG TPA: FAD binding domain-containing protein [Gaiellaceae bacterium]|nr:FAD binding domain-containing protein [Gaiellaceae bacterium]